MIGRNKWGGDDGQMESGAEEEGKSDKREKRRRCTCKCEGKEQTGYATLSEIGKFNVYTVGYPEILLFQLAFVLFYSIGEGQRQFSVGVGRRVKMTATSSTRCHLHSRTAPQKSCLVDV